VQIELRLCLYWFLKSLFIWREIIFLNFGLKLQISEESRCRKTLFAEYESNLSLKIAKQTISLIKIRSSEIEVACYVFFVENES